MPVSDAPTTPLGTLGPGRTMYATWVEDALEQVPDLRYPESVHTYQRMRHDPTLTGIAAGYLHPIVKAPWHVDPAGASERATRAVADSLGLPVLGEVGTERPDRLGMRNRAVQWRDHLPLAGLSLLFGHACFEPFYRPDGDRALLAGLPERMPWTISRIHVDDATGEFLGITQGIDADQIQRYLDDVPEIPAGRLVWYVNAREGAAWQGRSVLRSSFGPWLLKQEALRVHATSLRRFGAGTPVMEAIPGFTPTPAQVTEAARAAQNVRVGDSGGVATPGFSLHIKGVEGTLPDALPFLRYLDEQMRVSALQSVLDLASTAHGSRALGDTFMDILGMALQSVAENLATTATLQIAGPITTFTDGENAPVPRIAVGSVTDDARHMVAIVEPLIKAGAIQPDEELEGYIREAYNLPQRTSPRSAVPAPSSQGVAPADPEPSPAPDVTAARGGAPRVGGRAVQADGLPWPYARPLTTVEAAAGLDPEALDAANARITAVVLAAWPAISTAQRAELVNQVEAAITAGTLAALADLTLDTTAAADALAAAVADAAAAGVASAIAEAATAGVTLTPGVMDTAGLEEWARTVAAGMGDALAASAGREAVRLAGPAADAATVAEGVGAFLEGLSDAAVRDAVNGVVEAGMGSGRMAAALTGPGPRWIHSSVRDTGTCSICAAMDGHEYADQADAEAAFPTGGYSGCLGRFRCRCILAVDYSGGAA